MSKELTALEVFKTIRNSKGCLVGMLPEEDLDLIETTLKEGDKKLKKLYKVELKNAAYYNNLALKYKRAADIIKTKRVDIAHLQDSKDYAEYNEVVGKLAVLWRVLPLTEEEYQIVKEIYK